MKGSEIFRFTCLVLLWLIACFFVVTSQPFSLRVAFVIVASGIIVFVPIYKKYRKRNDESKGSVR